MSISLMVTLLTVVNRLPMLLSLLLRGYLDSRRGFMIRRLGFLDFFIRVMSHSFRFNKNVLGHSVF